MVEIVCGEFSDCDDIAAGEPIEFEARVDGKRPGVLLVARVVVNDEDTLQLDLCSDLPLAERRRNKEALDQLLRTPDIGSGCDDVELCDVCGEVADLSIGTEADRCMDCDAVYCSVECEHMHECEKVDGQRITHTRRYDESDLQRLREFVGEREGRLAVAILEGGTKLKNYPVEGEEFPAKVNGWFPVKVVGHNDDGTPHVELITETYDCIATIDSGEDWDACDFVVINQ